MSQKKVPKEKKIPTAKIREGIPVTLKKALEHLYGAEALIGNNLLNDAVALIEFAIEEFGRAVILRDMVGANIETIEEKRCWYNHDYKYNAAFTKLPKELKTIWDGMIPLKGMIARAYIASAFHPSAYCTARRSRYVRGKGEVVSPTTRCEAVFIDYDETKQKWKNGIRANRAKLELVIAELKEHIRDF
jgi:AbiV family abortive infection protein